MIDRRPIVIQASAQFPLVKNYALPLIFVKGTDRLAYDFSSDAPPPVPSVGQDVTVSKSAGVPNGPASLSGKVKTVLYEVMENQVSASEIKIGVIHEILLD